LGEAILVRYRGPHCANLSSFDWRAVCYLAPVAPDDSQEFGDFSGVYRRDLDLARATEGCPAMLEVTENADLSPCFGPSYRAVVGKYSEVRFGAQYTEGIARHVPSNVVSYRAEVGSLKAGSVREHTCAHPGKAFSDARAALQKKPTGSRSHQSSALPSLNFFR